MLKYKLLKVSYTRHMQTSKKALQIRIVGIKGKQSWKQIVSKTVNSKHILRCRKQSKKKWVTPRLNSKQIKNIIGSYKLTVKYEASEPK